MDFQLARNLFALSRAQHEATEAFLHIDCLADCINGEIIISAASSEATEQLVNSTRATLVQLQNILATQSDEGARRLRKPRYLSLLLVENALRVLQRPMSLILTVKNQTWRCLAARVVLLRELLLVRTFLCGNCHSWLPMA